MLQRDPLTHLFDVTQAIKAIQSYTHGLSLGGYTQSEVLIAAVERKLIIVGEALNRLRHASPEMAARIPDCDKIIDFRNVLVHGYDVIDNAVVWDVIQDDLEPLRHVVQALLDEDPLP